MHYLFNGDDISLVNVGKEYDFYRDMISHVFACPNFSDAHNLIIAVYLIEDVTSTEPQEWVLRSDYERTTFFQSVDYERIVNSYAVILDIDNGQNRIALTFECGLLKRMLLSVGAADSLRFTSGAITLFPEFKINLHSSMHLHITTRHFPYTLQLNNVHGFQLESYTMLKGLIDGSISINVGRKWYRRHLIYCREMDSLLSNIETAGDFINMNPHLIDQYQENVTLIIEMNHLKERLFPKEEMDAFLINLDHYIKEYDRIIINGLNRIKELR